MPEELRPGEDEVTKQTSESELPSPFASTPEQIVEKGVEPVPEEYPIPATADAVERMKFLARDLAQLKYEQNQPDSDEAIREAIVATETELATLNSNPEVRQSYQEYFRQQVETAKQVNQLAKIERQIGTANSQAQKISRQHSTGLVSSWVKRHLQSLEEQKSTLRHEKTETLSDPEVELAWRNHQLREYRQQWEQNHFVETPSREAYIDQLQDLWADEKKVLATGPTGTGKTELVKRAARKYSGEPEVISGHQGLTTYEVYGKPKLGPGSLTEDEQARWGQRIAEAEDEGQRQFLLAQFQQQGGVVSGFNLGKLPQAAEDGRVVIYDEIDLIPSKTLLRHKADFNLRPGESFTIQEDSNQTVKIKEGFAVTATANLKSAKHKERDEIDPAILRLLEPLPIGYFPKSELYDLCLATLIDRRGALEMSHQDASETLARLVEATIDIQEAYLGVATKFYEKGGGSTGKTAFLDKAILDPGRLLGLLAGYQREALRGTTFKAFVEQGLVDFVNNEAYSEKERFTLLDILTQHGFLLGRHQADFLPAQMNADEWQKHTRGKTAVPEAEPTYLDPRSVASLDPFGVRQVQVSESAEQFLAQVTPQAIGREGAPEASSELESQLELPRQYEEMVKALEQSGMIEQLAGGFGITGIDGREYTLPSYAEIAQELSRPELQEKIDQGFTKLLIVPFGRSLDELIERYKETITKYGDQLQATNGDQLEIKQNGPLYQAESYANADIDGKLVYQPKLFDAKKHGGQTKNQILTSGKGFRVLMIEDLPDLPGDGAGQTIGGRKQLEANLSPKAYLNKIMADPTYQGEDGLTLEDWLVLAASEIENRQLVIDDWQGQGKAAYLPGAYFPASGDVPIAYWYRDNGQANLSHDDSDHRSSYDGVRVGVRVI
ncbi:MAG: AAA family ATPase [Candidatus Berkelbacteria bacterium]|nr:AAA family ATPase [Candidatus Berkelbacteria bacterium]MCR4307571.1 AAA family ATPase [Candidatus Berkelbacteria bacterium]